MITERKFDRLVSFDSRSRSFPIRALLSTVVKPRSYTWSCRAWLDQGIEGACAGFAVTHEAAARPVVIQSVSDGLARAIYNRAKELDPWPGTDYEGTSILAAIKAGKEKGWYSEYRWAFGEDDLAAAIGYKGPAVLGLNWYEGMLDTDATGFIRPTGRILGGYAVLCNGFSVSKQTYRLHNSWGRSWGIEGDAFVSRADMRRLLAEEGEACVPVVRAVPRS